MTPRLLLLGSASLLLLAACNPSEPDTTGATGGSTGGIEAAAEGEFCGGIAGIMCADGLTCNYEGDYPDAGGTCVKE